MGAGPRIPEDGVVYPGRWTVGALSERFKDNATFVRFCKFKWSFNIKPDMVIVSQGTPLLCVEAKLKSGEGTYPASNSERGIFGDRELDPVRQLEVQQFMFEDILQQPFHSFVIHDGTLGAAKGMRWADVFGKLDTSASIPSVNLLLTENGHLRREGGPF